MNHEKVYITSEEHFIEVYGQRDEEKRFKSLKLTRQVDQCFIVRVQHPVHTYPPCADQALVNNIN